MSLIGVQTGASLIWNVTLKDSIIRNNMGGSWYPTRPQISGHEDTPIDVDNVTFE